MKYTISQKLLAVGDDFSVKDESGKEVYYIDGKLFSFFGKKLVVLNARKAEIAVIKRKPFALTPTFSIKRDGAVSAVVKKRRFSYQHKFVIDVPGTQDYEIIGDVVGHEYTIRRGRDHVARVSKRFFGATDNYEVDIAQGDTVILLSSVVILDLVLHPRKKSAAA